MLLVYRSYYLLLLAIEKGEKPCSEDFSSYVPSIYGNKKISYDLITFMFFKMNN